MRNRRKRGNTTGPAANTTMKAVTAPAMTGCKSANPAAPFRLHRACPLPRRLPAGTQPRYDRTRFPAGPSPDAGSGVAQTGLIIGVLQFAFYIWYAISAGRAAKVLGDPGWKYVAWILVAPFLAMIPIPIVSTIIGVSPLSIKFLLGGQLQEAIRQEGLAGIHASV